MKHLKISLFALITFCSLGIGFGQNVAVDANFFGSPQIVTLQDLNLISPSGTQLFYMNMTYHSNVPNSTLDVILLIDIVGKLADGTEEKIAEGRTKIFTLSAGIPKYITNVNLKSELKIDEFKIVGKSIVNKMLAIGTLPDGTFSFILTVTPANVESGVDEVTETIIMNINNPTTIELIFPGRPWSEGEQNLPNITSSNPIFIWQGESSNPFVITLAKRDIADQDPENALSSAQKRWIVGKMGNSVSYTTGESTQPGSGYFPLEDGVYFWQAATDFQGAGGNSETIKSEIFGFKFTQLTGQTQAASVPVELMMALRSLFQKIELPADIINKFGNGTYIPLGYPKYNGVNMTAAGLRTILNMLESGELEFVNVENY